MKGKRNKIKVSEDNFFFIVLDFGDYGLMICLIIVEGYWFCSYVWWDFEILFFVGKKIYLFFEYLFGE